MLTDFQNRKLSYLFTKMDSNGDGEINMSDLELIVERVGEVQGPNGSPERLAELTQQYAGMYDGLVAVADTDKSGGVSLKEWLIYMDNVVNDDAMFDQVLGGLTGLFHAIIDADGNGVHEEADFRSFLKAIRADDAKASETFSRIDRDNDGTLTLDDLNAAMVDFFKSDDENGPAVYFFGAF